MRLLKSWMIGLIKHVLILWVLVKVKDMQQTKDDKHGFDSIKTKRSLGFLFPKKALAVCLLPVSFCLAGCSTNMFGDLGGLMGSSAPATAPSPASTTAPAPAAPSQTTAQASQRQQAGQNSTSDVFANLLAFNTPTRPANAPISQPKPEEETLYCPTISIPEDASFYRVGHGDSARSVEHQFSLIDVARECQRQGSQIALKIGAAGRLLLGPSGAPGHFTAPLRIAIRRDSDNALAFVKVYGVAADVSGANAVASFQLVTEPVFIPYTRAEADQDYTILIGFDVKKAQGTKPALVSQEPQSAINRKGLGIGPKTGLEEPTRKKQGEP